MPGLDLSALQGIDVHVHVESDGHGQLSLDDELLAASAKYFKAGNDRAPTVEQIADYYRQRQLAAVVFSVNVTTATGHPALSGEEMADRAAAHADVLIPFGSVDPLAGEQAVRRAQRLISDHGVRGFKFHPSLQGFSPDDRSYYPLYAVIEEAGLPAVFHTGQTGIGPACPAGAGSSCGSPIRCCSTTWPPTPACRSSWRTRRCPGRTRRSRSPPTRPTCTSICRAGRPSTSRPSWSAPLSSLLQDKVLFGADYPLLTPETLAARLRVCSRSSRRSVPRSSSTTPPALLGLGPEGPGA